MAPTIEDLIHDQGGDNVTDLANAKYFRGLLGDSDDATKTRLYLNEQKTEYIQVTSDETDVIYLAGQDSPLVLLMIAQETTVDHVVKPYPEVSMTEHVSANYLAGEIANFHLSWNKPAIERYINPPTPVPQSVGSQCLPNPPWGS